MNRIFERVLWYLARRDIRKLLAELKEEDKLRIVQVPEERLIILHHNVGRYLRNCFRQGKYRFLGSYSYNLAKDADGKCHFDDISSVAIKLVWKQLKEA